MKNLTILLLVVVIGAIAMLIATQTSTFRTQKATAQIQQQNMQAIDGATNPEMISDRVAYSMFLQLIWDHLKTNETRDRQRLEGYFNMTTLGRMDRDVLINVATLLQQRTAPLTQQAKEIKNRNFPNPSPEVMQQLTLLQRQREAITDELIATIPNRLSASGLQKLRRFTNEHVKRKVKILPPAPLPGGPGWQQQSPANNNSSAKHH
jgi:hypothetical protein